MKTKKRKAGRPKLPANQVREVIALRLTPSERSEFESTAKREGVSLSDWIRGTLKEAMKS